MSDLDFVAFRLAVVVCLMPLRRRRIAADLVN